MSSGNGQRIEPIDRLRLSFVAFHIAMAGLCLAIYDVSAAAPDMPADGNGSTTAGTQASADRYSAHRRIRYSFTLHNDTARPLEHARFSVYAPVSRTGTQRVDAVATSHPAQLVRDAGGNQFFEFALETLPPFGARVVSIEAELSLNDTPNAEPIPGPWLPFYTRAERFVESQDPRIVSLARSLKATSGLGSARNIYDWMRQQLRALSYSAEDRGAVDALSRRAGDCTEHAYLFAALARANAIPARVLAGFVVPESGVLDPHDYHNWAEFHIDGAWHIVDSHRGVFDRKASQYVAMRVISSLLPSEQRARQRYSASGAGLRVSSN